MSFIDLRSYFEARMKTVDPDLRQWKDAFNIENIPSTILDKSWHVNFGPFSYIGTAHTCLSFTCPVTLQVFLKGYREPKEAVDSAMKFADAIVKESCKPTNRLNQPNIKNVLPNLISIRELAQANDNCAVLELIFECEVMICN